MGGQQPTLTLILSLRLTLTLSLALTLPPNLTPTPTPNQMGNEARGLSDAAVLGCHQLVHIPMAGLVESLNVAACTAVTLAEIVRQRGAVKAPPWQRPSSPPLGSAALPGRSRPTGRPATASVARASRLQSRRFHRL